MSKTVYQNNHFVLSTVVKNVREKGIPISRGDSNSLTCSFRKGTVVDGGVNLRNIRKMFLERLKLTPEQNEIVKKELRKWRAIKEAKIEKDRISRSKKVKLSSKDKLDKKDTESIIRRLLRKNITINEEDLSYMNEHYKELKKYPYTSIKEYDNDYIDALISILAKTPEEEDIIRHIVVYKLKNKRAKGKRRYRSRSRRSKNSKPPPPPAKMRVLRKNKPNVEKPPPPPPAKMRVLRKNKSNVEKPPPPPAKMRVLRKNKSNVDKVSKTIADINSLDLDNIDQFSFASKKDLALVNDFLNDANSDDEAYLKSSDVDNIRNQIFSDIL